VSGHEFFRLHEHAARATAGVEYAPTVGLEHLHEEFDDAAGRVELSALFAFGEGNSPRKYSNTWPRTLALRALASPSAMLAMRSLRLVGSRLPRA